MALKNGGPANAWHGHFEPKRVPEGVWMRCDGCQATLFRKQVEQMLNVCPECNHHFSVSAVDRIAQLLDADTFEEWFPDLRPGDGHQLFVGGGVPGAGVLGRKSIVVELRAKCLVAGGDQFAKRCTACAHDGVAAEPKQDSVLPPQTLAKTSEST